MCGSKNAANHNMAACSGISSQAETYKWRTQNSS